MATSRPARVVSLRVLQVVNVVEASSIAHPEKRSTVNSIRYTNAKGRLECPAKRDWRQHRRICSITQTRLLAVSGSITADLSRRFLRHLRKQC